MLNRALLAVLVNTAAALRMAEPPVRPFCGCYLLRSCDPAHPRSSYIGFTVNPLRRVRQHNGEIQGGARRTRRHRPWEAVALVDGFASQVEALQFEWAWQHPEKSLAVRGALDGKRKARTGWKSRLALLEVMCDGVDAWRGVQVRVCIEDALPDSDFWRSQRVSVGALDAWPPAVAASRVVARRRVVDEVADCAACGQPCAPTTTGAFVACERCGAPTHLTCLAEQALRRRGAPACALVPATGCCPVCDHESDWTVVVRAAKRSLREAARPPPPPVAPPAPRRARAPAPAPASDDDDVFDLTQTQATQETVAPDESDDDDDVDLSSPVVPPAL